MACVLLSFSFICGGFCGLVFCLAGVVGGWGFAPGLSIFPDQGDLLPDIAHDGAVAAGEDVEFPAELIAQVGDGKESASAQC